ICVWLTSPWTARACSKRAQRLASGPRMPRNFAPMYALRWSARARRSRTAGREDSDNLLALLTESEALFAYLIAVTGACEKSPQDARRTRRAARLLIGLGEVLRRIGAATNDAQWNRLADLQLRL